MPASLRAPSVVLISLLASSAAMAQSSSPKPLAEMTPAEKNNAIGDTEVTKREQPDYAAQGLNLGGFTLFPKVEVNERYTDNLYYTQWDRKTDYTTTVSPNLYLKSNWSSHSLEASLGSDSQKHLFHDKEDVNNYNGSVSGKFDVSRELNLTMQGNWAASHEPRSSPDDAGGIHPTPTQTAGLTAAGEYIGPRVHLKLTGDATDYQFSNVQRADGSLVHSSLRNRVESDVGTRVGYEIIPDYVAFVEAIYNQRDYKSSTDLYGYNRNSHGYELRTGTELEISGALRGEVFASYLWQDYDDAAFQSINAPGAGATLTWTPTRLTTVKAGVKRSITETTFQYSAGNLSTEFTTSVAHELRRNIILEADTGLTLTSFEKTGRHDQTWIAGTTATYKFNRTLYTSLDYHVSRQDNNIDTGKYLENAVYLKLGVQY